jgi:cell pole-organizing protein PopZ
MSDAAKEDEPSIEEILDSIRQIISEDDGDSIESNQIEEMPDDEPEDDIIELTQVIKKPESEIQENIEIDMIGPEEIAQEAESEPKEEAQAMPEPKQDEADDIMGINLMASEDTNNNTPLNDEELLDAIISESAEQIAVGAFAKLAQKAAIDKTGTVTVEDIVRKEIRPILRTWIDDHLPTLMERLLQDELEKIAKRAMEE